MSTDQKYYKFRGGVWIGYIVSSWPFGILEVYPNALILRDVCLGKEIKFSKQDIERIEIKKVFPIIGYGIRIYSRNEKQYDGYIFWYVSFRFNRLLDALKEFNYL